VSAVTLESGGDIRGIGARLRAGRERIGLSLLQAAEKLHVDAGTLEALESERFAELGPAVFVRGHIRRYAELVRESPGELQGLYAASHPVTSAPDLTRGPHAAEAADRRRLLAPGLALVIGVALIGSVWWVFHGLARPSRVAPPPAAPASAANVPAATAAPAAAPSAPQPIPTTLASTQAAPRSGALLAPTPPAEHHADTPEPPRVLQLALHFSADSWTEVYDAQGQRLFYDIGSADSVRTVSGKAPLRVVLGNAPGVTLELNGHALPVPTSAGEHGGTVEFRVSRSGHVVPSRLAATAGQNR
jgi:cytoskeleton protein RodZ